MHASGNFGNLPIWSGRDARALGAYIKNADLMLNLHHPDGSFGIADL